METTISKVAYQYDRSLPPNDEPPLAAPRSVAEEELLVSQELFERGDRPLEEVVGERDRIRCVLLGHITASVRDAACFAGRYLQGVTG